MNPIHWHFLFRTQNVKWIHVCYFQDVFMWMSRLKVTVNIFLKYSKCCFVSLRVYNKKLVSALELEFDKFLRRSESKLRSCKWAQPILSYEQYCWLFAWYELGRQAQVGDYTEPTVLLTSFGCPATTQSHMAKISSWL